MEKVNPKRGLLGKHRTQDTGHVADKCQLHVLSKHFTEMIAEINYLWDLRCDGDSEEIHGYTHAGHHEE